MCRHVRDSGEVSGVAWRHMRRLFPEILPLERRASYDDLGRVVTSWIWVIGKSPKNLDDNEEHI